MSSSTDAPRLQCDSCGYDLRAQADDGRCPECGLAVAESRRMAPIPRRPAWGMSDPRWRRRILAGIWVLALVPLMAMLRSSGLAALVPIPTPTALRGVVRSLDDTFLHFVYPYLAFPVGVVLLFAKERDRRAGPLDWTRRWGVALSYCVLLVGTAVMAIVPALVLVGIAAVFHSIPPPFQPAGTELVAKIAYGYLGYSPLPSRPAEVGLAAFSAAVVLLACVPLYDALRSSGPRWLAASLLIPLAISAVAQLAIAGKYAMNPADTYWIRLVFFEPQFLSGGMFASAAWMTSSPSFWTAFAFEAAKWAIVLAIAIVLTVAQIAAWRRARNNARLRVAA